MTDTQPPISVAVDDGFADIKVAWLDEDGTIQTFATPSTAGNGWSLVGLGSNDHTNAYSTGDNIKFTVAESVPDPLETRFQGYYNSPLNRILIHHALFKAGFENCDISIITGVPPESFQNNLERISEEKRQSLSVPVYRRKGKKDIVLNRIVESSIGAQAIAAYINTLINDKGERDSELDGQSVAIVDIGGGTTDYIAVQDVEGEMTLIQDVTHSKKTGLLDVYKQISRDISNEYAYEFNVREDIVAIAKSGELELFGEIENVSEIVKEAKLAVAKDIIEELENRIRAYPRLRKVIFVGGGADALREEIKSIMPRAIINDDARFANAKGMLKYAVFLSVEE